MTKIVKIICIFVLIILIDADISISIFNSNFRLIWGYDNSFLPINGFVLPDTSMLFKDLQPVDSSIVKVEKYHKI
jgi:hypothetical protein